MSIEEDAFKLRKVISRQMIGGVPTLVKTLVLDEGLRRVPGRHGKTGTRDRSGARASLDSTRSNSRGCRVDEGN